MYRTFNKSTKNGDGIDLKSILSETQQPKVAVTPKRAASDR
jgi:hypothetical protein